MNIEDIKFQEIDKDKKYVVYVNCGASSKSEALEYTKMVKDSFIKRGIDTGNMIYSPVINGEAGVELKED